MCRDSRHEGKERYDFFAVEPERVISGTGPGEDLTSVVRSFIEKCGPFAKYECEGAWAAEEFRGFLGPLAINPRIEVRIVCVNTDEHFERLCVDELLL